MRLKASTNRLPAPLPAPPLLSVLCWWAAPAQACAALTMRMGRMLVHMAVAGALLARATAQEYFGEDPGHVELLTTEDFEEKVLESS